MRFDDSSADPKPEANPLRFGGEEGIEYTIRLLWG
jgi:hypothetical protein